MPAVHPRARARSAASLLGAPVRGWPSPATRPSRPRAHRRRDGPDAGSASCRSAWLYLIQRVYYAYEDARTPFWLQVLVTVVATVAGLVAALVPPDAGVVVGLGQT